MPPLPPSAAGSLSVSNSFSWCGLVVVTSCGHSLVARLAGDGQVLWAEPPEVMYEGRDTVAGEHSC